MSFILEDIPLKKQYGQHFLTDDSVLETILSLAGKLNDQPVLEIGCGAGVLTRALLTTKLKKLHILEIDTDWIGYVRKHIKDPRMHVQAIDACTFDFQELKPDGPWVLCANLPYQITFPLFFQLAAHRTLFSKIVVMVQEEVAQRFTAKRGRACNWQSLFFQHFFEIKLDRLVLPDSFYPAPKVKSRLMVCVPRASLVSIPEEEKFWKFVRVCFAQPRRTLKNNLAGSPYHSDALSVEFINKRAQELSFEQLLHIWECLRLR